MITTPMELRAKTFDLTTGTWTLAALGVLFETDLADQLVQPRAAAEITSKLPATRVAHLLDVLAMTGFVVADSGRYRLAEGALAFVQQPMRTALLGDIRSHLAQPLAFLDAPATPGWTHSDDKLLQAQGDASLAMAGMFKQQVVPALGADGPKLDAPGARFLDVGVGVGSIAIGMCRAFPGVHVVGIDPYEVPLAKARVNVARAGLAERIDLRPVGLEDLRDDQVFDAAWVPGFFIPADKAHPALTRVHGALKVGGWVLLGTMSPPDPRHRATAALVTDLWGGAAWSGAECEAALTAAGFRDVRALPGPSWAPILVVGRRL